MIRVFFLASVFLPITYAFYIWLAIDDRVSSQSKENKISEAPIPDLPVIVKHPTSKKKHSSEERKEHLLSELEIEAINSQDAKTEEYLHVLFPTGKRIKKRNLDEDSYAEIHKTENGEEITKIYKEGSLTSEKWKSKGQSIIRSYENGRIFAISEEIKEQSTTLFYDLNLQITKRINSNGIKMSCIKYLDGSPYSQNVGACIDDDYREYDDVRDL